MAFIPPLAVEPLDFADGDCRPSKSSGRMNGGVEDALLRRGDGVLGESESDMSSMFVHSFREASWEAEIECCDLLSLLGFRGGVVETGCLRGRPTGRFGAVSFSVECSFRGLPRGLTGEVFEALSGNDFFRGRPLPRAGEVNGVGFAEPSSRGLPRPRLEATSDRLPAGSSGCRLGWCPSDVTAAVEKGRRSNRVGHLLPRSWIVIFKLASRGCRAGLFMDPREV